MYTVPAMKALRLRWDKEGCLHWDGYLQELACAAVIVHIKACTGFSVPTCKCAQEVTKQRERYTQNGNVYGMRKAGAWELSGIQCGDMPRGFC